MTVRAKTDRSFYLRFVLIGVAAFGFALWSLYDGLVKYPAQNERVLAYEKLNEDGKGNEWREFASQRGWPTEHPGELKDEADIVVQFIMAGIASSVGLAFSVVVLRSRGRWIEATQSRLTSSWGQSVDFDGVVSLDKKRWRDKGIAKITYQDGKRKRRFLLDNYKYDRQTTTTILTQLESRIGADKIVGGPPELTSQEPDNDTSEPIPEKSGDPD